MTKKIRILGVLISIVVFFGIIFITSSLNKTVSADDITIPTDVYTEINNEKSTLPQMVDSDAWIYEVELFNISDTEKKYNLTEDSLSYSFGEVGDYILRYHILYKVGDPTYINQYKETVLHVEDTQIPTLELLGGIYKTKYEIDTELKILSAKVTDNSKKKLYVSVCVYLEEDMLAIENDKIVLEEKGNYKIVYETIDSSGLSSKLEYSFVVE